MNAPIKDLQPPVFIVSTGRAGSTMLAYLLGLHPAVFAVHEPHPHLRTEAFVRWYSGRSSSRIEKRIRRKRDDLMAQVRANRLQYIESSNYASHLIEELHGIYQAKFVHLHRNGRDFVNSGLQRDWYRRQSLKAKVKTWLRRKYLWNIGQSAADNLLKPPAELGTRFEQIAWLWVEINRAILHSFSQLPQDRCFTLCLDKLDMARVVDLHQFIDVPVYPDLLEEMMNLADSRPNKTRTYRLPKNAEWSEWESRRFQEIAGDMMRRMGYDGTQ